MKNKIKSFNYSLFLIICILLCVGLITLASSSSYSALDDYGDSLYYFKRQMFFAIVGIFAMLAVSRINYNVYKKIWVILLIAGIGLMLLVFVPGVGRTVNGARRWINLGFTSVQPSEAMKIIIVIASASYISANLKKNSGNFFRLYGPIFLVLVLIVGIMYFQNHMSGMLVILVAAFSVIFASGIKFTPKLILSMVLILAVGAGWFLSSEFRRERIFSFANSEEDIQGSNWQATQSKYAIGTGGVFGLGIGQSRQKYLWLPEAQNDFIFSILAEETGLIGAILVTLLFAAFIMIGFSIAMKCKDLFGMLMATRNYDCICISNNYKYICCNMYNSRNRYATSIF